MTAHRALIPLSLVALAATLAGCGGGSSSGSSRAEFIKRADAICLRASKAQDALSQPASNAELAAYVKHVYVIERSVVVDLRRLQPPSGDRTTVNDMLDSVDRALAFESDVETAAMSGDQSAINSAQAKGARDLNHATTVARRYGFKECGNS
jgi:hypothetical protein